MSNINASVFKTIVNNTWLIYFNSDLLCLRLGWSWRPENKRSSPLWSTFQEEMSFSFLSVWPSVLGCWISNSGGPWFKTSTLTLSGFVLSSPEFNSSTESKRSSSLRSSFKEMFWSFLSAWPSGLGCWIWNLEVPGSNPPLAKRRCFLPTKKYGDHIN